MMKRVTKKKAVKKSPVKAKKPKVEKFRLDLTAIRPVQMAEVYKLTLAAVSQWDCPRNPDGSFDLAVVVKWREERLAAQIKKDMMPQDRAELEKEKLGKQIEKMELDIQKMKSQNISLELHEQILCSRAEGLKTYWTESFDRNLHLFAHKAIEQLRPLKDRFVRECMNQYARGHK